VKDRQCGVWVVDLRSGQNAQRFFRFEESFRRLFDVQVLPGIRYPEILNRPTSSSRSAYTLPDERSGMLPAADLAYEFLLPRTTRDRSEQSRQEQQHLLA